MRLEDSVPAHASPAPLIPGAGSGPVNAEGDREGWDSGATLTRGEHVVYHELTGLPRSDTEIARECGLILVATRRHLRGLADAGMAIKTEMGWMRA